MQEACAWRVGMTKHDQTIECMEVMHDGMTQLSTSRDIWQNQLIWWICKSLYLLLEKAVKEKSHDIR